MDKTNEISEDYEAAIDAHRAAYNVYVPIRNAYRAGEIDDTEYLAGRVVYTAALETYESATLIWVGSN